jgi:predicted P-loop ATPase
MLKSTIIDLNVRSIEGELAYEYLLYGLDRTDRRNDGRLRDYWLRQYQHIENGGWWCSGVNLFTGEESEWGCYKPDTPRIDPKKAKPIKYEHPPKVSTQVFALKVPTSTWEQIAEKWGLDKEGDNFWKWVISKHQLPLIVTEGAKKAGALLSAGYPAIALPGIRTGYRLDGEDTELIPELALFSQKWRQITLAFDTDKKYQTVQDVNKAIEKMGELFSKKGCEVFAASWRASDGKGVDDMIANNGREAWDYVYERRQSLNEFKESKNKKYPNTKLDQLMKFVEIELSERLAYNELTMDILCDGEILDFDYGIRCWFFDKFKLLSTNDNIGEALYHYARRNSFHPVKQYLEQVAVTVPPISIDNLATRYLGTNDPLYDSFLKRWLIGAVARVYQPGCKFDEALILQGKTGVGKSTFLETLGFADERGWLNSSTVDISHRDGLMVLHKYWLYELAEFDQISSKKAAATIKAFMSNKVDALRLPYGRKTVSKPRGFALCGSVNKSDFLYDETGNRRFWVIPIPTSIDFLDIDKLREERNAIWAAAVCAYRRGESWRLSRQEEKQNLKRNQVFEVTDEWESEIADYVETKEVATIKDILSNLFNIEIALQDKRMQWRVSTILTKLGWKKGGQRRINGKRCVVWLREEESETKKSFSENLIDTCGREESKPLPDEDYSPPLPNVNRYSQETPPQNLPPAPQRVSTPVVANSERRNGEGFAGIVNSRQQGWSKNEKNKSKSGLEMLQEIPDTKYKKYEQPKVEFHPGDRVMFEEKEYSISNATHTHVRLAEINESVPVWQVERISQPKH